MKVPTSIARRAPLTLASSSSSAACSALVCMIAMPPSAEVSSSTWRSDVVAAERALDDVGVELRA